MYNTIIILIAIVMLLMGVFYLLVSIEGFFNAVLKRAPTVQSNKLLRAAVINEIAAHYPDMKTVLDIGSGWGGMARRIARENPKMNVTGVEFMPMPYLVSRFVSLFRPRKNLRFIRGDAFKIINGLCFPNGGAYLTPLAGGVPPCFVIPAKVGTARGVKKTLSHVTPPVAQMGDTPPASGVGHPPQAGGHIAADIGIAYLLTPEMPRVVEIRGKFRVLLVLDYPLPNIKPTRVIDIVKSPVTGFQHRLYVYEN